MPASLPEPQIDGETAAAAASLPSTLTDVAVSLRAGLGAVLEALPDAPHRPAGLVKALGVNRSVASRLLGALDGDEPLELLNRIPGPEPLRKVVRAARRIGVDESTCVAALGAVDAFETLIREQAGTRPALDALIAAALPGARGRFELASRYAVHKGLSQLKGAVAEHWLGAAVVVPSADDPEHHDLTWLNGAVALQRLRPGAAVRFGYRHRSPGDASASEQAPMSVLPLDAFCEHPPARLDAQVTGDTVQYTLPHELLGPSEVVDLFVVDHHPAAMRRRARDVPRHRNSLFVEPAVPVASLQFDVLLHEEAFPGCEPTVYVYDTGYDGIANVNDPARDIDRVDMAVDVSFVGPGLERVTCEEVGGYPGMLRHLAARFGWDPARFRTWSLRMRYPVYGWQVCLSFDPQVEGEQGVADDDG